MLDSVHCLGAFTTV